MHVFILFDRFLQSANQGNTKKHFFKKTVGVHTAIFKTDNQQGSTVGFPGGACGKEPACLMQEI